MKTETWHFVTDHFGNTLAAFPERELAEMYSENTSWRIEPREIQFVRT